MKYYLQSKNGNHTSWKTVGTYKSLNKASQACVQKMKQKRGSAGFEWFKTRVVIDKDGEEFRVYPPQSKPIK